jgi:hypothetical protein
VFFEPFDALALLWNLFSCRSISFAPVRGGSHFLCTGMPLALGLGGCSLNRLMCLRFYEACIGFGLLASPLCGAAVTFFAQACRWRLGLVFFEPSDALALL